MDLVQLMRGAHNRPSDAIDLIAIVCRDRPWMEVVFRTENGITEFYILLDTCVGVNMAKNDMDVGAACRELVRTQRNYILHNDQIQLSLSRMILKLSTMRESGKDMDATTVEVLRDTLRETIVPFCLFVHHNMDTHSISEILTVLSNVVFVKETSVLHQWPNWRRNKGEGGGADSEKTCPITLEPIIDGIIASDGHLYERAALLTHMVDKHESPMTREYLDLDFVTFTSGR
jgi:hypothetical protein